MSTVQAMTLPQGMTERSFECPECRLRWPPARCTNYRKEGMRSIRYAEPYVRCVECKTVFSMPVPENYRLPAF